jgi:hypothetical protein
MLSRESVNPLVRKSAQQLAQEKQVTERFLAITERFRFSVDERAATTGIDDEAIRYVIQRIDNFDQDSRAYERAALATRALLFVEELASFMLAGADTTQAGRHWLRHTEPTLKKAPIECMRTAQGTIALIAMLSMRVTELEGMKLSETLAGYNAVSELSKATA